MKNRILFYGRLLTAFAVGALCLLAFFKHIYPIQIFNIQFVPALQSTLISGLGMAAVFICLIILFTLIFGRVYCAALCPLGLFQEFLMFLFKPFYKRRKQNFKKHHAFAGFLAAVLFGFLFGGSVVLLKFFDPYSILGNALSGASFGLAVMLTLTVLVFFKKRFFCTNICPVGFVLGFLSKFSFFQIRIRKNACRVCGLCTGSCPTDSIDLKNKTVNNQTCIKCFKCLKSCSHSALYYGVKEKAPVKFSPKRRELIKSGALLLFFGAAFQSGLRFSKQAAKKFKAVILPAGAGNVHDFSNCCLNCNLCVQNCRMKIIKPATKETPFVHLDYGSNACCAYRCNECSKVCPSGAIKRISLKEKQRTKIATAIVNEDMCIQCGVCAYECPKRIIIKKRGQFPLIAYDACIGCGKCATVCPVQAISIKPVNKQITLS